MALAIANSQASAIQAALNNGNYTVSVDNSESVLTITGFGPFASAEVAVGAIKVSISRDAILTGSLDTTAKLVEIRLLALS